MKSWPASSLRSAPDERLESERPGAEVQRLVPPAPDLYLRACLALERRERELAPLKISITIENRIVRKQERESKKPGVADVDGGSKAFVVSGK